MHRFFSIIVPPEFVLMPVVFVVLVVLLLPFKEPFQKLANWKWLLRGQQTADLSEATEGLCGFWGTVPRECVTVRHHFVILKCCWLLALNSWKAWTRLMLPWTVWVVSIRSLGFHEVSTMLPEVLNKQRSILKPIYKKNLFWNQPHCLTMYSFVF